MRAPLRNLVFGLTTCLLACTPAATDQASDSGALIDGGSHDGASIDGGNPFDAGWRFDDGGARVVVEAFDVSLLYPLPDGPAGLAGLIAVSAVGRNGPLLPAAVYSAVGPISGTSNAPGPGSTGTALYPNLQVVAARFDPCFGELSGDVHASGCRNQLRLVVQEVVVRNGQGVAADSAMHLFYDVSREDLLAATQALARQRQLELGSLRQRVLGPHPLLEATSSGAFERLLRSIVLDLAGASTLRRVTQMNGQGGFDWLFRAHDVQVGAQVVVTPVVLPGLPANTLQQRFSASVFGSPAFGVFQPRPTGADSFELLLDSTRAMAADPAVRQAAYDALLRVENPSRNSPDTVDCGACHLATPAVKFIVEPVLSLSSGGNAHAFAPPVGTTNAELTPTLAPNGPLNLHAFSYHGRIAAVSQRTVNETVVVAAMINAAGP